MAALLLCRQLLCLRTSTIIIIIIIGIHIINNKVDASARVTFPPQNVPTRVLRVWHTNNGRSGRHRLPPQNVVRI